MKLLFCLVLVPFSCAFVAPNHLRLMQKGIWKQAQRQRPVNAAKRKGDLFNEIADIENSAKEEKSAGSSPPTAVVEKEKSILAPEEVFFEGPPSWTEMLLPGISVLTVIGIVPFVASVSRQAWVKYKITSRRISVTSGFNGQDLTEVTYDEIFSLKFVYRSFGSVGDLVIELRDGAKLEMRSVPEFESIYEYIFNKCDAECQKYSDLTMPMKEAIQAAAE